MGFTDAELFKNLYHANNKLENIEETEPFFLKFKEKVNCTQ